MAGWIVGSIQIALNQADYDCERTYLRAVHPAKDSDVRRIEAIPASAFLRL